MNWNVFGYEVREAKKLIVETSKTVRGQMLMEAIDTFTVSLDAAYDGLKGEPVDGDWMTDGLRHFASRTIFSAVFATVFGRTEHVFNPEMVFANFETFHKLVVLQYFSQFIPLCSCILRDITACHIKRVYYN